MKHSHRLAALAAGVALALTACSGNGGSPSNQLGDKVDADKLATLTGTPTGDVDKVSWNLPYGEPASLDWTKSLSYSENTVVANLCESLFRLTPTFDIEPGLAESSEHPDPTTFVYKIRNDVTFWDGTPMTVDDVVYSLKRHMDKDLGSFWASYYDNVTSVEATADNTVTVKLTRPDSLFDRWMATPAGAVGQASFIKAAGRRYGTPDGGVSCTGPFRLKAWNKGSDIVLERNEDYWDSSRRAKTAEFDFRFLVDENAATSALMTGEIDGTYDAPLVGITTLDKSGPGKLWLGKTLQSVALLPTEHASPLRDPRIREALRLAIDYDGIVKQIYKGTATPLRAYAPTGTWGYESDAFKAAYDALPAATTNLDAARAKVAEAGSPQGEIVIAAVSDIPLYAQLASVVQDAGKKIGLNVRLQAFPTSTYTTFFFDRSARNQVDAFFTTNYTDLPDPLQMYTGFVPGHFYNYSGYDNPTVTEAIEGALATEDPSARAQLVIKAQAQIVKDLAVIPIVEPANRLFMNNRITGAPASFDYLYYPWAADVGASGK